jgi:poly-gamma-glutamate capsule biosynthesis protein CapA/YwtB (metallophosphatase superfamily)
VPGSPAADAAAAAVTEGPSSIVPSPAASSRPSSTPTIATHRLPVVPVAGFWSAAGSVDLADIVTLWRSGPPPATRWTSLAVDPAAYDALAKLAPTGPGPAVTVTTSAGVRAAVAASDGTLGLIAADAVTPNVAALALDGASLFGVGRVAVAATWPLTVATTEPAAWNPDREWVLVAGGDVNLDRRVYLASIRDGRGVTWPWSGGGARIDRIVCCGAPGMKIVEATPSGRAGAVARLFGGADLAIVNLEGSVPDAWQYRPASLTFTFDPTLVAGLGRIGIDAVSLANNHVWNAGSAGVLQTCRNVEAAGLAHAGAGADPAAARSPAWLWAAGRKVALLAYTSISGGWVSSRRAGVAPLRIDDVVADIRAAKAAGADIVVVMPHWGTEYSRYIGSDQRRQAAAMVAAGADLVLGSHPHWAGGLEAIARPGGPAFIDYSMGDLLFDLDHDVWSNEGVVLEFSFIGTRLAQVRLHPTVMMDGSRFGLLDPAGDGAAELTAIRTASSGRLDW